jgi:aminopeptidase N
LSVPGLVLNKPSTHGNSTRTHRAQLGLYSFADGTVAVRTLPVTYSGARTPVPDAAGLPCPDMVYANHGEWDYARARLERAALPELSTHLAAFDDPLTRLMLWQGIWDMVREARLPATDYIELVLDAFGAETNETIERHVLGTLDSALGYTRWAELAASERTVLRGAVEDYLWNRVNAVEPGSDRQVLYFDLYVGAAETEAGQRRLAALLASPGTAPAGVTLDQDRRWSLLRALAAGGASELPRLLAAERERDGTEAGRVAALTVETARPLAAVKTRWLDAVLDPRELATLADFRAVTGSLFPATQRELKREHIDRIFDGLDAVVAERDSGFVSAYVGGLIGSGCTETFRAQLDDLLEANDDWPPIVVRALKDSRFETARCLRIAALENGDN